MQKNKFDTIVVGGGIAGLTASVYLSKFGQNVLLVEKNNFCGGLVNTFENNGFHFDAGVRALEDAGVILPMIEDLKMDIKIIKSPVSIGIEKEILNVDNLEKLKEYSNILKKLFPQSQDEVNFIIKEIKKAVEYLKVLYDVINPKFKDLKADKEYLLKELLPWLPKYLKTVSKIKKLNSAYEDYLGAKVKNKALLNIVFQHFFKRTPAFFALSYFFLYPDYFYPKGGVGSLANAMTDKLLEFGGKIDFNTTIEEVYAPKNYVVDNNGRKLFYDNLIWAADLKTLYKITNVKGLKNSVLKKFEQKKQQILNAKGGESVFSIFIEIDEKPEVFSQISNGHFFYTPSKIGLGETNRQELDDLLSNWKTKTKADILQWLDKYVTLNTFEISIPVLKDPSMAPDGKTGMIVSFLFDYEVFKLIKEDNWYEEFKKETENKVIDLLADSMYPMLKTKLINKFSFSPLSIYERVKSSEGAITGWAFENKMPSVNQMHKMNKSVLTPIKNIFIAGQWSFSPSGVPMAILTGRLSVDRAIKNIKNNQQK